MLGFDNVMSGLRELLGACMIAPHTENKEYMVTHYRQRVSEYVTSQLQAGREDPELLDLFLKLASALEAYIVRGEDPKGYTELATHAAELIGLIDDSGATA